MDLEAQFSKKTNTILFVLSVFGFLAGIFFVAFSNHFSMFLINIVEKILNRNIDHTHWQNEFSQLFLWPIFLVIFFNAIIFIKYSPTTKNAILFVFLAGIIFLVILMHTKTNNIINSDDASEMLLWKECFLQKSLMPRSWHYSTEIRILNTQIFGAIFFSFFSNWVLIKTCVSLCSLAVLFFATMFLLKRLNIKEFWARLLCAILVVAPSSNSAWHFMVFGNYYIPHMTISFLFTAIFIDLVNEKFENEKHKKIKLVIFIFLAFFAGLASIRYMLTIFVPLFIAMIFSNASKIDIENSGIKKIDIKSFLIKNKELLYSTTGLFIAGVGYLGNNVLHQLYSFARYDSSTFHSLDKMPILYIFRTLLELCGFHENVLVSSPHGLANIFVVIFIVLFVSLFLKASKIEIENGQKILFLFFTVNFIFNTFIFLNVEFDGGRYYFPITSYAVPCVFVLVFNKSLHKIKRFALGVTLSVALLNSTFYVSQNIIRSREQNHTTVANFLKDNYSFGYATFWNANIITALTDGKVEVGILGHGGTPEFFLENYETYNWLTPKRYYEKDFKNDEKIFLLITTEEFKRNSEYNILGKGKLVYVDDFYRVYDYENHAAFRNGF